MDMEGTCIFPLTAEMAQEIAGWRYPEPYDIYSLNPADSLEGLLDGSSYGLQNGKGQLVGFYQFGREARIPAKEPGAYPQGPMDLGLGLAPHLCGLGLGQAFVEVAMDFARKELGAASFRLTVAAWNQRAKRVYLRCGFAPGKTLTHALSGAEFLQMEK